MELQPLQSIYFGGGTPSLLDDSEIQSLLDFLQTHFSWANDIEITLEANPDDLTKNYLTALSRSNINRLSIGTQSFFDEDLKLMNRAHTAKESEKSIKQAQDLGFSNLSIDLIYGSPTSNFFQWKENLQKIIDFEVPHVSSYALTIEPKTAFENWIKTNKISAPNDAFQQEAFTYMSQFLKENAFEHYEISNFAMKGWESRHNSAYWQNKAYLGVGPSAHSYDGKQNRSWNVANNALYIRSLNENRRPSESEILSFENQHNEFLMIGLRTKKGLNLSDFETRLGKDALCELKKSIQNKIEFFEIENNHLKLKPEHWFLSDGIIADLFL